MKDRKWRIGLSAVAVLLLVLFASVGLRAITWGQPDGIQHPNVGAIVVHAPALGEPFLFCSGTLIAPRVYLTAAHCAVYLDYLITAGNLSVGELSVSFDPYNPLNSGTWHAVTSVNVHPLYGLSPSRDRRYDVAVIVLAQAINDIVPAILPYAGYLDDLKASGALKGGPKAHQFTVVGYGSQLQWPPPQIVYGTDRRVAESGFLALTSGWLFLSQNHAAGFGGTGYGDSGGPTFWHDEEAGDILVSTTVWGDRNTVATGITQRLDLPEILEFLAGFPGLE